MCYDEWDRCVIPSAVQQRTVIPESQTPWHDNAPLRQKKRVEEKEGERGGEKEGENREATEGERRDEKKEEKREKTEELRWDGGREKESEEGERVEKRERGSKAAPHLSIHCVWDI
jgi:hypothetical protein